MKITKTRLKQIIKEELEDELNEGVFGDIIDILFPDADALEKRRMMSKMSNEEIAGMLAKARAREEREYSRKAGILPQGEEIPGYGGVEAYQAEEDELAAMRADNERRIAMRKSDNERRIARAKAQGDKKTADRLRSYQAEKDRKARKAQKRVSMGVETDEDRRLLRSLGLQQEILQRVLEMIK